MTLSPFQQSIMASLWKDLPHKIGHRVKGYGKDLTLWCVLPLYGIVYYCSDYKVCFQKLAQLPPHTQGGGVG